MSRFARSFLHTNAFELASSVTALGFAAACEFPGTIMTEVGAESTQMEIANGILQAFASGTFIFVTFFEILQEEIDPHDTSIGKVLCALCGYVTVSLLILIPDGSTMTRCPTETTTTVDMLSDYTTAALTTAGNNLLG
jgi:hypothetical protein